MKKIINLIGVILILAAFVFSGMEMIHGKDSQNVALIIDERIYNNLKNEIDNYTNSVSANYNVQVFLWNSSSPYELRKFLRNLYENESFIGAILVGDVPIQKYYTYWEDYPQYSEVHLCPYYYMDVDGYWYDGNQDGILDNRTGDIAPEIWVGIIRSLHDNGNNISELKNYFHKLREYRNGNLSLPQSALVFIDDDWESIADGWASDVSNAYPNYTLIKDVNETCASRYISEITSGKYAFVHLAAHSWEGGHAFKVNGGTSWEYVYSSDIDSANPKVFFYNLFCCHAANFEQDCIAEHYIMTTDYGLLVIGSTKTGGMWLLEKQRYYMDVLYADLGSGKCFGDAFLDWFSYPGNYDEQFDYFGGMCILGDPLLTITPQTVSEIM